MPDKTVTFGCMIDESTTGERYTALVTMRKPGVVSKPRHTDNARIELAHAYIEPVSGQLITGFRVATDVHQDGRRIGSIGVAEHASVHHHFVLYDVSGRGKYIVRNAFDQTVRTRECSTWDLGSGFATRVTQALTYFR